MMQNSMTENKIIRAFLKLNEVEISLPRDYVIVIQPRPGVHISAHINRVNSISKSDVNEVLFNPP
jgi:hypothetical protein